MATLTLHQPTDMTSLQAWDGTFSIVESGHIRATDGVKTQDYFGSFGFSNGELTSGTLTSTAAYENGLVYEVTDLAVDAAVMAEHVLSFDFDGALNEVFKGNDTLIGSSGNDHFKASGGSDHYDGTTGIDTLHYSVGKAAATVTASAEGYSVQTQGKTDTLVNIERIKFADGSLLALDVNAGEHAGAAYRLYQAAFDRSADKAGLNYWVADLDKGNSLQQVAKGFVDSAEFKSLNPGTDTLSIINNLYQHVLHRDADAAGVQYWEQAMAAGMSTSDVLVSFSESQENINNTSPALDNGLWLV